MTTAEKRGTLPIQAPHARRLSIYRNITASTSKKIELAPMKAKRFNRKTRSELYALTEGGMVLPVMPSCPETLSLD